MDDFEYVKDRIKQLRRELDNQRKITRYLLEFVEQTHRDNGKITESDYLSVLNHVNNLEQL